MFVCECICVIYLSTGVRTVPRTFTIWIPRLES